MKTSPPGGANELAQTCPENILFPALESHMCAENHAEVKADPGKRAPEVDESPKKGL